MNTPVVWRRPNLVYPSPFDTIFFDVDGVLINTTASFDATDIAVTEYVVGTLNGLDWGQQEGEALVTRKDIETFRRAGGYNNDWDMCFLLAALATARLREWRGTSLAERSTQEWADIARAANLEGRGGRAWVRDTVPATALPDYQVIGDIYHECYWGAGEIRKRFGREPRYLPHAESLVYLEEMLYAPDFPRRLRKAGIQHMGLITGRVGPEVDIALERMEAHCAERWWESVISADICAKPDPFALRLAIAHVGAGGGLFIGDTADDHDLVRNYRARQRPEEPDMLVAVCIQEDEVEVYKQREPDFIVHAVEDLLWCLSDAPVYADER